MARIVSYVLAAVLAFTRTASSDDPTCRNRTLSAFPDNSTITSFLADGPSRGSPAHIAYVDEIFAAMGQAEDRCNSTRRTSGARGENDSADISYELLGKPFFSYSTLTENWWLEAQFGLNNGKTLTNLFAAAPPRASEPPQVSASSGEYCSKWSSSSLPCSNASNQVNASAGSASARSTVSCKARCTDCNIWFNNLFFFSLLRSTVESKEDIVAAGACVRSGSDTADCREATVIGPKSAGAYQLNSSRWNASTSTCSSTEDRTEPWHWSMPADIFAAKMRKIQVAEVDVVPEPWLSQSKSGSNNGIYQHNYSQVPIPVLTREQARWSSPMLQCGRSHSEWVQILTAPIVARCGKRLISLGVCSKADPSTNLTMVGSSWVTIKLDKYKINQCGKSVSNDSSKDVFVNTARCKSLAMDCESLDNVLGRNAYGCKCLDGFFIDERKGKSDWHNCSNDERCFNGSKIAAYFPPLENPRNELSAGAQPRFSCSQCQPGCTKCVNLTPCTRSENPSLNISLLTITLITMLATVIISLIFHKYRNTILVQSSVPIFLHTLLIGALISYLEAVLLYFPLSNTVCKLQPWPRHIGFILVFGALLAKLWRIQILTRVPPGLVSVQYLDRRIMACLVALVGVMVVYLVVWTVVKPPTLILDTDDNTESFQICSYDWWRYTIHIGKA